MLVNLIQKEVIADYIAPDNGQKHLIRRTIAMLFAIKSFEPCEIQRQNILLRSEIQSDTQRYIVYVEMTCLTGKVTMAYVSVAVAIHEDNQLIILNKLVEALYKSLERGYRYAIEAVSWQRRTSFSERNKR